MTRRRKKEEKELVEPFGLDLFDEIEEDEDRDTLYLFGDITGDAIEGVVMPLMQCLRDKKPVELYISTPGGDPMPALMIADIIDRAESSVEIYLMGEVCSSGFLVALSGYKNELVRTYAYPSTRVMWHSGSLCFGDGEVPYALLKQHVDYHDKNWIHMCNYITSHSKMTMELLEECELKDKWFFPEEMLKLGIIDEIL